MTLPALRALRAVLPDADVTLLAKPWVRDVYPLEELRFRTIDYDAQVTHRGLCGRLAIARRLQRDRFDLAVLLQNAFDAALVAWMARIPIRAGYSRDGRHLLLTHPVKAPRRGEIPAHESHYYLELLKRLGLITDYQPVREITLPRRKEQACALRSQLAEMGAQDNLQRVVGISPGASFGTAKRWPADYFSELVKRLGSELQATCVLFGSAEEAPLAEQIAAQSNVKVFNLAGKITLAKFSSLVTACDIYLTNDTGTMHVAAALGVPTLAIFGPTNETETAPLGPLAEMIVGIADCRPCKQRHCPYGHHQCMISITPQMVFDRIRTMLTG